jgi:hypothetical protein
MTDYIMPVEYKYVDNIDSKLISVLDYDIIRELNYFFSDQRLLEAKILMINEVQYIRNLNEVQKTNLIADFNSVDIDSFFYVCIQCIRRLFDASEGNFFAMQTARDAFSEYVFRPRINYYSTLNNIDNKILGRSELSRVLAVLVPAVSMRNTSSLRTFYNSPDPQCFYGEKALLEVADPFIGIANRYFI